MSSPNKSRISPPFSPAEQRLTLGVAVLFVLAVFLPSLPQDPAYSHFADVRAWGGVPRAADVLSNLAFALFGGAGLWLQATQRLAYGSAAMARGVVVFFWGMLITAVGSGYYHWAPTNETLVWDRLAMVVTFAGVLGMAATQFVSPRAGRALGSVAWPVAWPRWLARPLLTQ